MDHLRDCQWWLSLSHTADQAQPLPAAQARPLVLRLPVHIRPLLFQALLFPSSLQRPHRQPEGPPSAARPSPPPDPLSQAPKQDPRSVTSLPSVLMNRGQNLGPRPLLGQAEGTPTLVLWLVQELWLLGLDHMVAQRV